MRRRSASGRTSTASSSPEEVVSRVVAAVTGNPVAVVGMSVPDAVLAQRARTRSSACSPCSISKLESALQSQIFLDRTALVFRRLHTTNTMPPSRRCLIPFVSCVRGPRVRRLRHPLESADSKDLRARNPLLGMARPARLSHSGATLGDAPAATGGDRRGADRSSDSNVGVRTTTALAPEDRLAPAHGSGEIAVEAIRASAVARQATRPGVSTGEAPSACSIGGAVATAGASWGL